jgi:hypothetical protein
MTHSVSRDTTFDALDCRERGQPEGAIRVRDPRPGTPPGPAGRESRRSRRRARSARALLPPFLRRGAHGLRLQRDPRTASPAVSSSPVKGSGAGNGCTPKNEMPWS